MKLKDALIGLMIWLLALIIVFSVSIEDGPVWAVAILAFLVWTLYIFVIIHDYRKEKNRPLFWLEVGGEWRAIDGYGNLIPRDKMPPKPIEHDEPHIYDQKEDE